MLCDICQKQEATRHETHCTNIRGDVPKQRHLCDDCFNTSNPTEARSMAEALKAGCRYCGGEPYGGGLDSVALLGGVRKMSFMCKPCSNEYYGFLRLKFPGFGDPNPTEEQMAVLVAKLRSSDFPAILVELEAHMKKWVIGRDSQ
jgi:hypothetical protein